jgi:hypothetical protein
MFQDFEKKIEDLVDSKFAELLRSKSTLDFLAEQLQLINLQHDQLLTTEEACEFLHICRSTLHNRIEKGEIIPEKHRSGKRNLFSQKHLRDSLRKIVKPKAI